jgi:hypothetical protein
MRGPVGPSAPFPDYLEFVPEVRDPREFADLSTRVSTYFGDSGVPLYLPGKHFDLDPSLVPHFEPSLVQDPGWSSTRPAGEPWVLIHRTTPATAQQRLKSPHTTYIVDHMLHAHSELYYYYVRHAAMWPTYPPPEIGLERLRALKRDNDKAFILTTGPSALTVDFGSIEADLRITCNSAVRDIDRIKELDPSIIACTDPVFHFGPSRYAAEFRRDLLRAVDEVDAVVLAGHDCAPHLLGLMPSLADRLVVMPTQLGGPWRIPNDRNPTVRVGQSVLVNLMLPVAMMLCDEVAIAGADGRRPEETYFWKHNQQLQYSDELMQTAFDAHPAFFRDRDYADYYDIYCDQLEELMTTGESSGKTITAAAASWIPALRKRGAPEPAQ